MRSSASPATIRLITITPHSCSVAAQYLPEISEKEEAGGFKNGCFRKGAHTICSYADEVSMLRAFGAYITSRDPDILSGWNFVEFDMPYITGRMEKLGLSPVMLARLPGMTRKERTSRPGALRSPHR